MSGVKGKLLIVATVSGTLSGFLLPYADHFRSQGWIVDGAAQGVTMDPECHGHFDNLWEIEWSRNPWSWGNLKAGAQISDVVRRNCYDIVHVHTPVASFVTRLAVGVKHDLEKLRPVKTEDNKRRPVLVYTAHGFHCHPRASFTQKVLYCALEKLPARYTDALVVINREDERLARALRLAGSGHVYYMPGIGINLDAYSRRNVSFSELRAIRMELGLAPADHLFVIVAALMPGKRHQDAIRALSITGRRDFHLALAGVGPELERLRTLAAQLSVAARVHFLGRRSDVPQLLAAATALILPSDREGLPRSVLEAMAMGTPVVGTRIRGTRELLEEGAGLLVEIGDAAALASAMQWVVDHPQESAALAERAHKRVRRYALERIISLHETLYEQLLDRP